MPDDPYVTARAKIIEADDLVTAGKDSIDTATAALVTARDALVRSHAAILAALDALTPPEPPPPPPPPVFYDATVAEIVNGQGVAVFTDNAGFIGEGYFGVWGQPNEAVVFDVPTPRPGRYSVGVRYQNAGDADASRLVNDATIRFPRTTIDGDWAKGSWVTLGVEIIATGDVTEVAFAIPADSAPWSNWMDLNGIGDIVYLGPDLDPFDNVATKIVDVREA